MLLLILGLWWASVILAQGLPPGAGTNASPCEPILDVIPAFQKDAGDPRAVLGWPLPLTFAVICNSPPAKPLPAAGNTSGLPAASYSYITSAVDPDKNQVAYTFDWGDGTTSESGPVDSGALAGADHIWSRAGMYQIRVRATDGRGTSSPWSEPLAVIINTPPQSPGAPSGPESGRPGSSYRYEISGADPDGDRMNFTVDWGDGTVSTIDFVESGASASANHTWSRAGMYQIRVQATDGWKASSPWSEPLAVIINTPPDTPLGPSGASTGKPGAVGTYAFSTTDPDDDQLNYTIDWGDATSSIVALIDSGKPAGANRTWSRAGTYQVRVRATDSRGASSAWSEPLMVIINSPPDTPCRPSGPLSVYAWAPYRYSAAAADPEVDLINYTFDWGDGNATTTDFIKSGLNASVLHTWSDTGTYQLRIMAADSQGAHSEWSESLTITVIANNRPEVPRNLYGSSSSYTGVEHSYFTMAKDPDNDWVRYTFDWGDGTISTTDQVKSGSLESARHIWRSAGMYHVQAVAMDSKGAASSRARSFLISIEKNDPPHTPAMPSGPKAGEIMAAIKYSTNADDADGDRVKYVFDWGDGTTSWTGLDFIESGTPASVFHQWSQAGVYRVRAMAMDDKGATSGWSSELVVDIS